MSVQTETIPHDDEHWLLSEAMEEYRLLYVAGKAPKPEEFYRRYPAIANLLKEALEIFLEAHPDPSVNLKAGTDSASTLPSNNIPEEDLSGHVFGDYLIIQRLGAGAMGVVYEAEDKTLNRRVALKVTKDVKLSAKAVARFKEEASIIASLHHENIVPIFSFDEVNGRYFYAMQLIDGIPLNRIAQSPELMVPLAKSDADHELLSNESSNDIQNHNSPLTTQETTQLRKQREFYVAVAKIGVTAARALQYAHTKGIQHFDVKPGNLLLDRQNKVWLTDFGVAEFIQAASNKKNVFGTIGYISPEAAGVQPGLSNGLSDIYSLGATLYSLATGKSIYSGPSSGYLAWLQNSEPLAPRRRAPAMPRDLETIILKALSKRCEDRYQSAQEVADDLTRFLSNRPIQASPPQLLDIAAKAIQRNRRPLSIATASLLVILTLFSAISFQLYRRAVKSEQGYSSLVLDIFKNLDDHGNLRGGSDPQIQYNRLKTICDFLEERFADDTISQSETFLLAQMQYYAAVQLSNIGTNREEVFARFRRSADLFKSHAKLSGDPLHRLDAIRSRMLLVNNMTRPSEHGEKELEMALAELDQLISDYPKDLRFLDAAAWAHLIAYNCYSLQRNREESKKHLHFCQNISRKLQQLNPEKWWFYAFNESIAYTCFIDLLLAEDKPEEALAKATEGVELFQKIIESMEESGEDPTSIKDSYLLHFKNKLELLWILNRYQEFLSETHLFYRESSSMLLDKPHSQSLIDICSQVKLIEADIYKCSGQLDLAKKTIESTYRIAESSKNVSLRLILYNPFSTQADFEQALTQIAAEEKSTPVDNFAATNKLMALIKCRKFEEAAEYFESNHTLFENDIVCGYLNAFALKEVGRITDSDTKLKLLAQSSKFKSLGQKLYLPSEH